MAKANLTSTTSLRMQTLLSYFNITLYFINPRTGSSAQLTENRTTLDLSFLISPDVPTNSIVTVFIGQRGY